MTGRAERMSWPIVSVVVFSCGCFSVETEQVVVRDPSQVALQSATGTEIIAPSSMPSDPVIQRGTLRGSAFWQAHPFQIDAVRESTGELDLRCDACGEAPYPLSGQPLVPLVDASGHVLPYIKEVSLLPIPRPLALGGSALSVPYDLCLVDDPDNFCKAEVKGTLVSAWSNVAEIRDRKSPVRTWGKWMIGGSAVALAMGTFVLVAPGGPAGRGVENHLIWGGAALMPGLAMLAYGLWHVYHPAEESIVYPVQ